MDAHRIACSAPHRGVNASHRVDHREPALTGSRWCGGKRARCPSTSASAGSSPGWAPSQLR
jgi:hypothetical protein